MDVGGYRHNYEGFYEKLMYDILEYDDGYEEGMVDKKR